jgi:type VI protein secretion system component VasK
VVKDGLPCRFRSRTDGLKSAGGRKVAGLRVHLRLRGLRDNVLSRFTELDGHSLAYDNGTSWWNILRWWAGVYTS